MDFFPIKVTSLPALLPLLSPASTSPASNTPETTRPTPFPPPLQSTNHEDKKDEGFYDDPLLFNK